MRTSFLYIHHPKWIFSLTKKYQYPKYQKNMIEFEKIEKLIKQLYKDLYGKTENNNLLVSILKNTPKRISFNNKIIL